MLYTFLFFNSGELFSFLDSDIGMLLLIQFAHHQYLQKSEVFPQSLELYDLLGISKRCERESNNNSWNYYSNIFNPT